MSWIDDAESRQDVCDALRAVGLDVPMDDISGWLGVDWAVNGLPWRVWAARTHGITIP